MQRVWPKLTVVLRKPSQRLQNQLLRGLTPKDSISAASVVLAKEKPYAKDFMLSCLEVVTDWLEIVCVCYTVY